MANVPVVMPDELRDDLKKMADETGISSSALMRMAAYSLVANYHNKGSFIFADLLNPDHKGEK